jgi:hypothetical protein
VRELDIDADRATRLIIQLKDKPDIFAIETVELRDRPVLELKDGEDYKVYWSLTVTDQRRYRSCRRLRLSAGLRLAT